MYRYYYDCLRHLKVSLHSHPSTLSSLHSIQRFSFLFPYRINWCLFNILYFIYCNASFGINTYPLKIGKNSISQEKNTFLFSTQYALKNCLLFRTIIVENMWKLYNITIRFFFSFSLLSDNTLQHFNLY